MPSPGQILCYEHFRFTDGVYGDKLLVVLNTADLDTPCLVLKTTSHPERYLGSVQGCNVDRKVFFAPVKWQACFLVDTYIQLYEIFEIPIGDLLKGSVAKKTLLFLNIHFHQIALYNY